MSEPQNCPAPVLLTSYSNVSNENQSCHDRVESICGNSTSLGILEEFRRIYEERLRKIDEEMGGEGMELKLKTLTSWVNDLGEQNQMLVETVEQLEREAGGRVALLEERLRKSSHVALKYMSKLEEYDNQIWGLSERKVVPMQLPFKASNGVIQAQQNEEILRSRLTNLQNDISGLLELIRRARCEGSWDTNGISFSEVNYEDIFGSHSHQNPCDPLKSSGFDISMKPKINLGNYELDSSFLKQEASSESEEIKDLTKRLEDVNTQLQITLNENERLVKEVEFLSDDLKNKTDRIATLSQNISEKDKNELEYRITDLEATYLRLERSWDHAWEISKNTAMDDLVYYQNELQEGSKSCTFDIPEKMTWCTAGIKKDQEKIRELCEEIKSLLQSSQHCTVKRGVSFASPSKEDYKLQVQELQKALKQAQNGVELARKQMTKNIFGLRALRSQSTPVSNYNQQQSYSRERFDNGDLNQDFDINRYFTDISQRNLPLSHYRMGKELEKLSIFSFQKCSHCNIFFNKKNDAFNVMEQLQMEIETLKSTVSSNQKVILDQQEMLNIQQEALALYQEEVRELQSQIKNLECSNEDESKQVQEQLITISNLHQDLMTTKHHLEEFQEESCFNAVKQSTIMETLRNENVELSVFIFFLKQDIGHLENHVCNILHTLKSIKISFEDEEKKNKALQSKCQDFERKFNEAKEYWLYLLQQAQKIEEEINKCDNQPTKIMEIIMNVIACIKYFCLKYFVEEEIIICDEVHSGLDEHGPFELVQIFPNNEDDTVNAIKGTDDKGLVNLFFKNSVEEFESSKLQNSVFDMSRKKDSFKNIHLNELRKILDVQTSMMKRTGKINSNLPMRYSEAIVYCNYIENEIDKLQDLLIDFHWQMKNLEPAQNEVSEKYKSGILDYSKYQVQMENTAEREAVLQEDFTVKERNWWKKMQQGQVENLNYADSLHILNEEIDLLQVKLNERDSQLQTTTFSLRSLKALSIESSLLQKELQKQETNVEKLEEQLLKNNIKLQTALSYLDEKNNLLQKLNKENHNMQDHLKNLEIKFQNSLSTERHIFFQEISNLKLSIQQLKKLHEKSNLEIREHWWWDDGWQI